MNRIFLLVLSCVLVFFGGNGPQNKIAFTTFWRLGGLTKCEHPEHEFCPEEEKAVTNASFVYCTADTLIGGLSGIVLDIAGPGLTLALGHAMVTASYIGFLPLGVMPVAVSLGLQGVAIQTVSNAVMTVASLFPNQSKFLIAAISAMCELGALQFTLGNSIVTSGLATYSSVVLALIGFGFVAVMLGLFVFPNKPFDAPADSVVLDTERSSMLRASVYVERPSVGLMSFKPFRSETEVVTDAIFSHNYILFAVFWLVLAFSTVTYNIIIDQVFIHAGVNEELGPFYEYLLPACVLAGLVNGVLMDRLGLVFQSFYMNALLAVALAVGFFAETTGWHYVGASSFLLMRGSCYTLLISYLYEVFDSQHFGVLYSTAATSLGLLTLTLATSLNALVDRITPAGEPLRWTPVVGGMLVAVLLSFGVLAPLTGQASTVKKERKESSVLV
ncbi:MAG: uncharacterized protein KVP18_000622 [Porospora cf. gigantea A]|uniref:uncharacterized protein n=1 Tax=Porospora cf. gigantea A TaxID=2853593 RepID=UPI00355AAB94|nr:MAG: hypothetical protein KVP18_000622 [Porospora cf. gigantea A]